MSATDKIKHAGQDAKGKVKAAVGHLSGDRKAETEGKADQTASAVKKAGEKVKETMTSAMEAMKHKAKEHDIGRSGRGTGTGRTGGRSKGG